MRPTRRSPLKLSLLSCAIASAVAGFSPSALAVDLCAGETSITVSTAQPADSCNLNQADATLTVTSAGSIGLGVDVNADGVTITNSGDISASQTALHYLGSHAISTLTNNGDITVNGSTTAYGLLSNGTVDLDGTLLNNGRITVSASTGTALAAGIWIADDVAGLLGNSGHITVSAQGSAAEAYGINVEHEISGSILSSGNIGVTATASTSDAYAYGISTDGLTGAGSISNTGTISATANAVSWASAYGIEAGSLAGTSSVSNAGQINATVTSETSSASANGIRFVSLTDGTSVTNTGTITLSAIADEWAGAYGMGSWSWGSATNDGGAVTNARGGVITARAEGSYGSAYGLFSASPMTNGASITNAGTISATTVGGDGTYASAYGIYSYYDKTDSTLGNSGSITATASGTGSGWVGAFGIKSYSALLGTSAISNSGTIVATATAASGSASAFGMDAGTLDDTSSMSNSGHITATASSTGTEQANAYGMRAGDVLDGASVSNSGTIEATATAASGTASAFGIYTANVTGSSSVTNSGSISATASSTSSNASAWGIRTGVLSDSASVVNSGSVVVSGDALGSAYGIQATSLSGSATLTNSGDIDIDINESNGYAYGVAMYVSGGMAGTSRVENSGDISVSASGTSAAASGLWVSGSIADGVAMVNSGSVQVQAVGSTSGAYAYGWSAGTLQGALVNEGVLDIRATAPGEIVADGMWVDVGNGAELSNEGEISATGAGGTDVVVHGIWTNNNTLGTTITNSGTIVASATAGDGNSSAATAFGIYANSVDATSSISNSGDIVAEAAGGSAQAYGIFASTLDGTVTNTGTIMVDASGSSTSAYGMFANGGSGSVVNSGSILGGVSLGGTVDLDNSGHILTTAGNPSYVGGDYTQGTDGLLTMQVQDAGTYAALNVGGEADFTASESIHIIVTPDVTLVDGSTLANVISAGTLTTDLDGLTVTDSSLFWAFTGVMDGDTLDVDVDFAGAAAGLNGSGQAFTASQLAFADSVLLAGAAGTYSVLSAALNGAADAAAAADALESVGPGLPGAAAAALRSMSAGASNAISARQGEIRGAAAGDAFTQNALWLKPFIGQAEQDSVDGVDGYDVDSTGFVIGLDGDVSDAWRLGVAVASGQGEVGGDKVSLDVSSTQLTVYGSYAMSDSATLDLNIDHLSSSVDSTRRVALANTSARASYDASQFAFGATVSNRVAMGEKNVFIPSLQARYQRASLDGYTETGAGVYDLTVESSTEGSLLWAAEGAFEFGVGKGTLLASAGLGYDTLDAASLTSTLSGNGPTFISNGIKPDSTVITGGLGYRHVTAKALEISVAYDMESRGDFVAQTASVKFKLPL